MALEIERKFLCNLTKEEADKLSFRSKHIESIYLKSTKEYSVRVIKDIYNNGEVNCKWTEKSSNGDLLVRKEVEEYLPEEIFNAISSKGFPTVIKQRYLINIDNNIWEVDFFNNYDFVIAELEFDNREVAESFNNFPQWIGKEVTNNPFYLNCNLAK